MKVSDSVRKSGAINEEVIVFVQFCGYGQKTQTYLRSGRERACFGGLLRCLTSMPTELPGTVSHNPMGYPQSLVASNRNPLAFR